jgi:hypothetical protein
MNTSSKHNSNTQTETTMKTRLYNNRPVAYRIEFNRSSDDVYRLFVVFWNPAAPERGQKAMDYDMFFEITTAATHEGRMQELGRAYDVALEQRFESRTSAMMEGVRRAIPERPPLAA